MESPDFDFCDMCRQLKNLSEEQLKSLIAADLKKLFGYDIHYDKLDTRITGEWVIGAIYHHDNETIDLVEQIFIQGDSRYHDWEYFHDRHKVASFIFHKAINIEDIKPPDNIEIKRVRGLTDPQKEEKKRAIAIMKRFGYTYKDQEVEVVGGVADVIMRNDSKDSAIVECCSCKVSKGIEYLAKRNAELWIFTKDGRIYKVSRGQNWDKMYRFHKNYRIIEHARIMNRCTKRGIDSQKG